MSETLCYEIYLEFEYNGKFGRIGLPVELKPRFKTLDPNAPSSEFISSLISDSEIKAAIEIIVNNASVFPGDPRADQVKKTIREVLEGDHYSIEVEPINCEFDNIFGDPDNEDKPYPSVDDTAPPVTNQPNTDLANPDRKCYVATFTINYSVGTENREISVTLYSSADPLPDPLDTGPFLTKPEVLTYIQNVAGQPTKDKVSQSFPDGAQFLGVSWNGEFWKLKGGNGACADQDDPDPPPGGDDPQTPEDEGEPLRSITIERPKNIFMSGRPSDEEIVEVHLLLDDPSLTGYDYIDLEKTLIKMSGSTKKSFLRPSTKEIPNGNANNPQQQNLHDEFINKLNLTPNPGKSLNIFTWKIIDRWKDPEYTVLRIECRRDLGNTSALPQVPQEITDQIPDTITATFSLNFTVEITVPLVFSYVVSGDAIGDPEWSIVVTDRDESSHEYTIEKIIFVPEPPPETAKKGEDFDATENIVKELSYRGRPEELFPANYKPTLLKNIIFTVNFTSDPFTIVLEKKSQKIAKYTHSNYLVVSYSAIMAQIINEQIKLMASKPDFNSKIDAAFSKKNSLDPEKDGQVLEKIADGLRDILLKKAKKNTPAGKQVCSIATYNDQWARVDVDGFGNIKIKIIEEEP